MAIPLVDQAGTPAGDIVHRQVNAVVGWTYQTDVKNLLVDAGWTSEDWMEEVTVSGTPANGNSLHISTSDYGSDAEARTFVTTINNGVANQVLVGATANDSWNNAVHGYNDDGVGKGTLYSTATASAHSKVSAAPRVSWNTTSLVLLARTAGVHGWYVGWPSAGSPATPISHLYYGGYLLKSGKTPQGLRVAVVIAERQGNVYIKVGDPYSNADDMRWGIAGQWGVAWQSLQVMATGRVVNYIAHAYGFWKYVLAATCNSPQSFCGSIGVPYLPSFMEGKPISAASGGGGSVVRCTEAAHARVDASSVYIFGSEGMLFDGQWTITVIDADTYDLQASTAVTAGTYTANSAYAAGAGQISRAWWSGLDYGGACWRLSPALAYGNVTCVLNQYRLEDDGGANTGNPGLKYDHISGVRWWFDRYAFAEVPVTWGYADISVAGDVNGLLYNAGWMALATITLDTEITDENGLKWHLWLNSDNTTGKKQSLWIRVPAGYN